MDTDQSNVTIATILSGQLPRLRVFDEELKLFEETFKYTPKYRVKDKQTYLGIEIEVENVRDWFPPRSPYWTSTDDGSLRNHGVEFISHPIRAWRVEQAIVRLFSEVNEDFEFTERTSIHIHMNVRTLTVNQLQAFVATYLIFEKLLFDFVGQERAKNIFCVPLNETNYGSYLQSLFSSQRVVFNWSKYTALNLLPIRDKGTVEFRHLHGTKDIKKIMQWINIILSLKMFALKNKPDYVWEKINSLNTSSTYQLFAQEVFGEDAELLWNTDNAAEKMASCISYTKGKCVPNNFRGTLGLEAGSPLHLFIAKKKQKTEDGSTLLEDIMAEARAFTTSRTTTWTVSDFLTDTATIDGAELQNNSIPAGRVFRNVQESTVVADNPEQTVSFEDWAEEEQRRTAMEIADRNLQEHLMQLEHLNRQRIVIRRAQTTNF